MKSRISITLLFLLLLAVFASAPPKTEAVYWVDDLGECSDAFVEAANYVNWLYDTYAIDEAELDYNLDVFHVYYTQCLSQVSVPAQEPDFCDAARAANQDCITQGQNLTEPDPGFYMECRQKSGIDLCQ